MKKKMFNQKTRRVEEIEDYEVYNLEFVFLDNFSLEAMRSYDQMFKRHVDLFESTDKPILFRIISDFESLLGSKKEKNLFYLTLTNIFVSHLFDEGETEHEKRMTPLQELKTAKMSNLVKTDLGNRLLKFPVFAIEFYNSKAELVHSVF